MRPNMITMKPSDSKDTQFIIPENSSHPSYYTEDRIDRIYQNEIFVFGSNLQGHHAGGAARTAM